MTRPLAFRTALVHGVGRPRPATGDLGVIGFLVAVHLALVTVASATWAAQLMQIPLGLALALFVPGYCLTAAIFPRAAHLAGVERIGLSIALSIASVAFLVLLLDALPWRLQPWSLILGEYALVGGLAALALLRRWGLPADEAVGSVASLGTAFPDLAGGGDRRGRWATAIALVVVLVAGSSVIMLPPLDRFGTEFYAIGPDRRIGHYPYEARPSGDVEVTLGIVNREPSMTRYRIEVWAVSEAEDARQLVQATPSIELASGESRELPVEWVMPIPGPARRVDVLLLRADGPDGDAQPYRELTFWIDVPRSAAG